MTEHVRYIDKTRAYYRKAGYTQDYAYADHDDCAFAPFTKALAVARIGLVGTASMVRLGEGGVPLETSRITGTSKLEVFSVDADWPVARLKSTSEDHDRFQTDMADVNAYFPKDHLRAFADEGIIGSFAEECWRILPNYSKRKVSNVDAPEVLRRAREAGVDAVVLTPV
jgi:D-proline reductase (dithiol) PrdB